MKTKLDDELLDRLRAELQSEDARYAYVDSLTNAFISTQIKELRETRGLSQDDLAKLVGTRQSGISRLERSDYSTWKVETLRKLARAFGVRLRIRFEEFGTVLDEIHGFNDQHLLPRRFENDPVFNPTQTDQSACSLVPIPISGGAEKCAASEIETGRTQNQPLATKKLVGVQSVLSARANQRPVSSSPITAA